MEVCYKFYEIYFLFSIFLYYQWTYHWSLWFSKKCISDLKVIDTTTHEEHTLNSCEIPGELLSQDSHHQPFHSYIQARFPREMTWGLSSLILFSNLPYLCTYIQFNVTIFFPLHYISIIANISKYASRAYSNIFFMAKILLTIWAPSVNPSFYFTRIYSWPGVEFIMNSTCQFLWTSTVLSTQ